MNIKSYRKKYRLSQAALAKRLGCVQSAVGQLERGDIAPSGRMIRKIIAATNGEVSLDDLCPHEETEAA